jgi:ferredoxin
MLDMAAEAEIRLPSGCLQEECSACLAKLVSGSVEQSEQKFLKRSEIVAGYTVIHVAYPGCDRVLQIHQEQVSYQDSLYLSKNIPQADQF